MCLIYTDMNMIGMNKTESFCLLFHSTYWTTTAATSRPGQAATQFHVPSLDFVILVLQSLGDRCNSQTKLGVFLPKNWEAACEKHVHRAREKKVWETKKKRRSSKKREILMHFGHGPSPPAGFCCVFLFSRGDAALTIVPISVPGFLT